MAEEPVDEENKNVSDLRTIEQSHVPRDRGWAWMVLLSAFMINFIHVGVISKSYGILYPEFKDKYNSDATTTAWIFGLANAIGLACSPLSNWLASIFGHRRVVLVGCGLSTLAFLLSAFMPHIELLFFSYSILFGIGAILAFAPSVVMVALYFRRRRSFAMGMTFAGSAAGNLLLPPILSWLLDSFGLRGTLIIIAGLMLQSCVFAMMLRPPSFYNKTIVKRGDHTLNDASKHFRWSLIWDPLVVLYGAASFSAYCGYGVIFVALPAHSQRLGIDRTTSALLLSLLGLPDFFGRIVLNTVMGYTRFPKKFWFQGILACTGAVYMGIPSAKTLGSLATCCVVLGFISGGIMSSLPVVLTDCLGEHNLASAFGFTSMCMGLGYFVGAPIAGQLRDYTGFWNVSFYCAGGVFLLGALMMFLEPTARKSSKAHTQLTHEEGNNVHNQNVQQQDNKL